MHVYRDLKPTPGRFSTFYRFRRLDANQGFDIYKDEEPHHHIQE